MLPFLQKYIEELVDSVVRPIVDWIKARPFWFRGVMATSLVVATVCIWQPRMAASLALDGVYTLRAVASPEGIVLGKEAHAELTEANDRLASIVETDILGFPSGLTPWTASQTVYALPPDRRELVDRSKWKRLIDQGRAGDCFCWLEKPQERNTGRCVFISGWVLAASSKLRVPISNSDVRDALSTQGRGGWWPMFIEASDKEFASTYATAWMVLGLIEAREAGLLSDEQKPAVEIAVRRGLSWLMTTRRTKARWSTFPNLPSAPESPSISGLVIHVLHRGKMHSMDEIDEEWLSHLPDIDQNKPIEYHYTQINGRGPHGYKDAFAQTTVPWPLVATVDAYKSGNVALRARALRWIEQSILRKEILNAPGLDQNWWRAEFLYGTEYLEGSALRS